MPIAMKDPGTVAAKWSKRAQAAGADYSSGVTSTTKDQAALAAAAAPLWASATADAASRNAFAKGVTAAGTAKWQARASSLGTQRYPSGVAASSAAYQSGVAPYFTAISSVTLPPRGMKGTNAARNQAVVDALRKVKFGQ